MPRLTAPRLLALAAAARAYRNAERARLLAESVWLADVTNPDFAVAFHQAEARATAAQERLFELVDWLWPGDTVPPIDR